jgi:tetratricopeptide (TPR) repeat protein
MLALQTGNRRAFELVANAVAAIASYKSTRDRSALEGALANLKLARQQDDHYLLAPYYIAVTEDLLGRSRSAAEQLSAILSEAPTAYPKLINEIRFNLAVAQYHGYGHVWLKAAAATLDTVLSDTNTLYGRIKHFRVRLHSRALLAQVYAMWSIPTTPEAAENDKNEMTRIWNCYRSANKNAYQTLYFSPMLLVLALTDRGRYREIKAIAHNALGMATMYYTDFSLASNAKLSLLRRGLQHFSKSDRLFPRDWANYCDIGSCHMRLGHWGGDATEFDLAREYLNVVVKELRPDYGFALYEIGRSYRIQGNFTDALRYFTMAMNVVRQDRDVSDERVQREINLAEKGDNRYP